MNVASALTSLPMYDWPEVRGATDEFWAGLSKHLGVTGGLARDDDFTASWRRPDLIFSQTCGYPFTHEFKGILKYVATPSYAAEGCGPGSYCSFVFARGKKSLADLKGATPAINSMDSMSGMLALRLVFSTVGALASPFMSGGHRASLLAVQERKADLCAVDSVCVAMAKRYRPDLLEGLTEIARSPEVPALPFVTRAGDVAKLRSGLRAAFDDPALKDARGKLLLKDVVVLPEGAYDVIPHREAAL